MHATAHGVCMSFKGDREQHIINRKKRTKNKSMKKQGEKAKMKNKKKEGVSTSLHMHYTTTNRITFRVC